jgi:O-antigen/teichoic acid export membrane protein
MRRALLRHSALNLAGQLLVAASALAVSIAVSRTLGPTKTGAYSLATFGALIAVTATTLGGPTTTIRYIAESEADGDGARTWGIARHVLRYALGAGAAVTTLGVLAVVVGWSAGLGSAAFLIACGGVLPAVCFAFVTAVLVGQRRFGSLLALNAASSLLLLVASVGVAFGHGDIVAFLLPAALAPLLPCIVGWRELKRRFRGTAALLPTATGRAFRRDARSISGIVLLDVVIFQRSEVFFLAIFSTHRQIAFYALAQALVSRAVAFVPGAITGVLIPSFSGADDLGFRVSVSMRWLALVALPLGGLIIALADPVVHVAYGSAYHTMVPVVIVIAAAATATAIVTAGSSAIYATGRQSFILKTALLGAAIDVVLAVLLTRPLGALGAAVAGAAAQGVSVVAGGFYVHHSMKYRLPLRQIAQLTAVVVVAGLLASSVLLLDLAAGLQLVLGASVFAVAYLGGVVTSGALSPEERAAIHSLVRRYARTVAGRA